MWELKLYFYHMPSAGGFKKKTTVPSLTNNQSTTYTQQTHGPSNWPSNNVQLTLDHAWPIGRRKRTRISNTEAIFYVNSTSMIYIDYMWIPGPVLLVCTASLLLLLVELHADLFSYHASASPLEVYVFVAVDDRGQYVSDGICGRCTGKQQRRRRSG